MIGMSVVAQGGNVEYVLEYMLMFYVMYNINV